MSTNEMARESGISYAQARSIVLKMQKEGIHVEPIRSAGPKPNWDLIKTAATKLKLK